MDQPKDLPFFPRKEVSSKRAKLVTCAKCLCSENAKCTCNNKYFSEWLDVTTVHGIVHVFKSKSPLRRILWTLIFLAAFIYCSYNIVNRSIYYASDPTSTTVSVELSDSLQFPAVTVCNLNPFPLQLTEEYGLTDLMQLIYQPYLKPLIVALTEPDVNTNDWNQLCDIYTNRINDSVKSLDINDILNQVIKNKDEFILECDYSGQLSRSCNFVPIFTNLGVCYTFKTANLTRAPGTRAGLYMVLDIDQSERGYGSSINANAGVKVVIHPPDVLPEPDELGISIGPGTNAYISLKTWRINDETNRNCEKTNKRLQNFPNLKYSISSCRANAYVNNIANNCGCRDSASLNSQRGLRNCTINDLCCATVSTDNITGEHCLPSCGKTQYTTTISYANFPSTDVVQTLSRVFKVNNQHVKNDLLAVNIYFEDLSVSTSTTFYSYSFTSLLSDIGGQLGLFIGASVISMLEVGWLLVDLFKSLICKKAWQKKIDDFEVEIQDHVMTVLDEKTHHEEN